MVRALRKQLDSKTAAEKNRKVNYMLDRTNGTQELDRVNMFIRAISDEMAQTVALGGNALESKIALEMQEALYELRLRKLLISALFDSDRVSDRTTSH